jgi:hypothetical protein
MACSFWMKENKPVIASTALKENRKKGETYWTENNVM